MKFKKIAAAVLAAAVLAATPATVTLFNPFSVTANAADTLTEGDYSYTVNEDEESVTITKYTGTDAEVDIPETLGGKTVTAIGGWAFSYGKFITIAIPSSVTSIGYRAFDSCNNLTSVTIPDSVTNIGDDAFCDCENLVSITIPNSITNINGSWFIRCQRLTEINIDTQNPNYCSENGVLFNKEKTELILYPLGITNESYTIPDGVTSIGRAAFYGSKLTSITIADSVTSVGNYAFDSCYYLESITIPNKVAYIGALAFSDCRKLASIVLPESVTEIDDRAFNGCSSITSVIIPAGVTNIVSSPFNECTNLAEIIVDDNNPNYSSENGVLFDKDKTLLINYPIGKKDTSYTIPSTVKTIGSESMRAAKMEEIVIPNGVEHIGGYAFGWCGNLKKISIPESVTHVEYTAFHCNDSLLAINVDSANKNYCSEDGILFSKDKKYLYKYPEAKTDTSYTVPDGVTRTAYWTFNNYNLESITLPIGIEFIGSGSFDNNVKDVYYAGTKSDWEKVAVDDWNSALSSATIHCSDESFKGETVKHPSWFPTIGELFYDGDLGYWVLEDGTLGVTGFASDDLNETVEELIIPEEVKGKKVTSIGVQAFSNCESLTDITIPNSVTTIDRDAFFACDLLETVYYDGTKAEWEAIEIGGGNECLTNAEIICTDGIINERDPETSEPDTSDTSEPTSSDTSEPTSSDTSEPTSSGTSEPTTSDTHEPTTSDTSEPTSSDTSEPTSSDTSEPTSSDTSEPTTSETSDPTDPDLFIKENEVSTEIEVPSEAADIPESDRITSITINPAFNMKNKHDNNVELDLSKITIKAEEIYDEDGLKRAEEALGETIKGNKHYNLLDLTLLYNGKDFSNGYEGLVKVIIPLPKGHRDKNFSCFRLTEVDGKMVKELIPGEQTEDSYIIYLEHFSLYALVADANPDDGEKQPEESKDPAESAPVTPGDTDKNSGGNSGNNAGNDQANTGIALAATPIVLACAAVIAASKKRK